jgi:hypothetical protein
MTSKIILVVLAAILMSGCFSTIRPGSPTTKSQDNVAKQEEKVNKILDKIEVNELLNKTQTSALSYGVTYSLSQIENPSIEVRTAKDLNERVISIIGAPNLNEAKRIKATVDLLNSEIEAERKKGEAQLADRDKVIIKLQSEKDALKAKYEIELWEMSDKAKEVAKEADKNKGVIDQMSGFFGLNAVFWGLKRFFISCLTGIIIFTIVFLILRIAAMSNPIAAAAFSVFDLIGSLVLNCVKALTPQAFEMAKFVPQAVSDNFKEALVKIVDSIQLLKEKQKDIPEKSFTLQDVLNKFDKEMDLSDKQTIEKILKEEKWKK